MADNEFIDIAWTARVSTNDIKSFDCVYEILKTEIVGIV